MYNYNPLWQTMKRKNFSTYKLLNAGISRKTLYNLQHSCNVTVVTLERLCSILDCSVEDVVEIIPEKE